MHAIPTTHRPSLEPRRLWGHLRRMLAPSATAPAVLQPRRPEDDARWSDQHEREVSDRLLGLDQRWQ